MMKNSQHGFTLIELMIVVVIMGILASIATAFFGDNVQSARRTDARSSLLATAAQLEKCLVVYGAYNNAGCSAAGGVTPEGFYTIGLVSASTTFTLTATPVAGSSQASDTCTALTLNNFGVQAGTGTGCW